MIGAGRRTSRRPAFAFPPARMPLTPPDQPPIPATLSDAGLGAVLDQLSDAVAVVALDGRTVSVNAAAQRLLGLPTPTSSIAEYAERAETRRVDGTPMPREEWPIARALGGESVRNQELVLRTPAGDTTVIAASAVPLVGADGVRWGAALVMREVNEEFRLRTVADEARRGAERRAAEQGALAAAVADVTTAVDVDEQLRRIARRAHALVGADYAAVAVVDEAGVTRWRAIDGNRSDVWNRVAFPPGHGTAGRVIVSDEPLVITGFPENPDFTPEEFPAHASEGMRSALGVPLRADGRTVGAIVVGWRRPEYVGAHHVALVQSLADVAAIALTHSRLALAVERRAALLQDANRDLEQGNEELRAATQQLEEQAAEMEMLNAELHERNHELDDRVAELDAVLDQMADGVLIVNAAGEFVRVNPAAERIYGRSLHDVTLAEWAAAMKITAPGGAPISATELPTSVALRERRIVDGAEWEAERPDGSRIRLLGSSAPLYGPHGSVTGVVTVYRDITERARLMDEVRHATQLKERFFAQMSHELRTPINAILGYSTLIEDGLAGEVPPPAVDMIGRIHRSGRHLLELVNDVLDISRLEAGKVSVDCHDFDVAALARDTMTSVEPQARAKGLDLAYDGPDSLAVYADPARTRQVLLNLASNAVKFTERGRVTIAVAPIADGRVSLAVRDTGPGIAPAHQESVFAEFVQVGNRPDGTGLGLAISRRLAALLGGTLTLESDLGRGSTFTLTLPGAHGAHGARDDRAAASTDAHGAAAR